MLPEGFVPAPKGLARETPEDGSRWWRAQTMWRPRPPTVNEKSGYVCVAILDERRLPTGVFKVGLHPKYSEEGLRHEADLCEMEFELYLKQLEKRWGEPIRLMPEKPPYLVNVVAMTCTCPDYQRRKPNACHHLMGVQYGLTCTDYRINPITGRVIFGIGK